MVEKDDTAAVRGVMGFEKALRRAIGVMALVMTPDRDRRFREAVLHRLRLKTDILQLASVVPGDLNVTLERRDSRTTCLKGVVG
jgi:hypothetical protein